MGGKHTKYGIRSCIKFENRVDILNIEYDIISIKNYSKMKFSKIYLIKNWAYDNSFHPFIKNIIHRVLKVFFCIHNVKLRNIEK